MLRSRSPFMPIRNVISRGFIVSGLLFLMIVGVVGFVLAMSAMHPATAVAGQASRSAAAPAGGPITDTYYLPVVLQDFSSLRPFISSFEVAADTIAVGTAVSLSWTIENEVDSVTISPGIGDVTALSSVTVTPTDSTTFMMVASNSYGSDSEEVTVHVIAPPIITEFVPGTGIIFAGESTTLSWVVENSVDSLTIDPDIGDVTGLSSIVISPTETTTYTLTAQNLAGVVTSEAIITVSPVPQPVITSFTADSGTINNGESTTLRWQITNSADSITIEPGIGDVTGQDSVVVSPNTTTTYTITAVNGGGSDTEQVTVTVIQPPVITSFTAAPGTINQGESSTLSWGISNSVDSVTITPGVGDVTGQSSVSVSPGSNKTYTLTATNSAGSDTAQVTVQVNPPGGPGNELLVFDWNTPVTTAHRGFPWNQPPIANGNWETPINYAQGTLYFRAEIRSQPTPQSDMKLQFCVWQFNNARETCGDLKTVPGTSGTVRTWSTTIDNMWKLNGVALDWSQPRFRNGIAIKNGAGDPVSNYNGWNWNGENPDQWYPLDLRFTVVVVEAGATFSGWDNWIP